MSTGRLKFEGAASNERFTYFRNAVEWFNYSFLNGNLESSYFSLYTLVHSVLQYKIIYYMKPKAYLHSTIISLIVLSRWWWKLLSRLLLSIFSVTNLMRSSFTERSLFAPIHWSQHKTVEFEKYIFVPIRRIEDRSEIICTYKKLKRILTTVFFFICSYRTLEYLNISQYTTKD